MAKFYLEGVLISCTEQLLTVNGQQISTSSMERKLLRFFLTHPNMALSRDLLLREVWGYETAGVTRTVDTHVKNLRARLGKLGKQIATVRGVGYRLDSSEEPPECCCKAS